MYSGEGGDQDPLYINAWFNAVSRYIRSFGIQDTSDDILQYYGAYCSDTARNQFEIYDSKEGEMSVADLKKDFEKYFLPSTSTDEIYHDWLSEKQTVEGKIQPI